VRGSDRSPNEVTVHAPSSVSTAAEVDRSARLVLLGSLAVLLGAGLLVLGAAHLLLPRLLPGNPASPAADARGVLASALTFAIAGTILIWAGIGSIRCRRWVPAVMKMLGWIWLVGGVLGFAIVAAMIDDLLVLASPPGSGLPPEAALIVKVFLFAGMILGGVVLPGVILLGYRGRAVRRTCEAHDPGPGWADACPGPVLGLGLGLGLAAAMLLPMAARPVVPWFGILLDGWPGSVLTVLLAVLCGALAFAVYRRVPGAWTLTTGTMVLAGISCAVTFGSVEPAELYRLLGYPEPGLEDVGRGGLLWEAALVWGSLALTLLSVAYMLAIRRQFARSGPPPGQT
jgi:hypothetical protein